MKPSLLVVATSDPRANGRTAEAIRMAAGIGTWMKVEVNVYLRGPAVLALSEVTDELVDEDQINRCWPILAELKRPIYVQKSAAGLEQLGRPSLHYQEIDDVALARLAAACSYVTRF